MSDVGDVGDVIRVTRGRNVSGWKFRREYSKLAAKCGIYGDLGVSTGQRLGIGEYAALERCFTAKDVEDFANVSGDKNPVHLDEQFAKTTRFGGRIVHGMLCGSLFSTLFATRLPGSIYINQSLKFVKPVYINDTIEAIEGCHSVTYADDTNVVCTAKSMSELRRIMEEVCERIREYSSRNGLCLNASKTEYIVIRNKGTKIDEDFHIEFGGERIEESESVKFLGIITSKDMGGGAHIDSIQSEVNRRISMIRMKIIMI